MIDKLTKNLGLSKTQVVDTMAKFSEVERTKSLVGKIKEDAKTTGKTNKDELKTLAERAKK